jgi:hypothetical protein
MVLIFSGWECEKDLSGLAEKIFHIDREESVELAYEEWSRRQANSKKDVFRLAESLTVKAIHF